MLTCLGFSAEINSAGHLLSPSGTHTSGSLSAQQERHMSNFSDPPFANMGMGLMGANKGPAAVMYPPSPDSPSFGPPQPSQGQQQAAMQAAVAAAAAKPETQDSPETSENGPFADPANVNKIYIVRRTFEPSLSDELVIFVSWDKRV
jgi:hypothetical protein